MRHPGKGVCSARLFHGVKYAPRLQEILNRSRSERPVTCGRLEVRGLASLRSACLRLELRSHPLMELHAAFGRRGGKGIRTPGLLIANETLYQLSYTPEQLQNNELEIFLKGRSRSIVTRNCNLYHASVKEVPTKAAESVFQKTDVPCLYRYSSTKVYFALFKHEGKQKRVSLKTTDKAEAKRNLAEERRKLGRVDSSQGKLTLKDLCTKYLATVGHLAKKTVERKKYIVRRLLDEFPKGPDCQVGKIRQSDLEAWLAGCKLGAPTHILFVQLLKELFTMAVNDKTLADSPAEKIRAKKAPKPVRITPSFEEFQSIIADVRAQKRNADREESADFLSFLGLVGVGQAEASGIEKQHVNLRKKQITFFRRKTRTPYYVPFYPQAEKLVMKLVSKPDMLPRSKLFTVKDAKKALAGSCKRLGLPAFSQRSLRRMFITRCIELGLDVKVIADWQGHRDGGKLILGTYSHVRNTHAEEMAKKLVV